LEQMPKDEAIDEFENIFLQKTGNPWQDRTPDRFQKKPGLFSVMELGIAADSTIHRDKALKTHNASKLPASVASLISLITDVEMIKVSTYPCILIQKHEEDSTTYAYSSLSFVISPPLPHTHPPSLPPPPTPLSLRCYLSPW
jgi:hypothetical protein